MTKAKKCKPTRRVMVTMEVETTLTIADIRAICRRERGKRSRVGTVLQTQVNVIRPEKKRRRKS